MKNRKYLILTVVLLMCISAVCGYYFGTKEANQYAEQKQQLQLLNRAAVTNMIVDSEPIYVIGHMSPDSDTVCTAIAYARLLTMLGHEAEAAVTMPVNKETAYILKEAGVEQPPILEDASGKSIFMVDHSEYVQAAAGMEDAHIVGVIDHHGIGTVMTGHQVVYEARPIGATATIVWLDYLNYGLEIDKTTAHVLLGAIISDTEYLTGSTTTDADRAAITELAKIAEVDDVEGFYKTMHAEKLSYDGMSNEEILFSDYKEYEVNGVRFGIGQVNAVDEETAKDLAERMKQVLPEAVKSRDVDLMYALVGIRENGLKIDRVIPCDERSGMVMSEAFPNYNDYDGISFLYNTGMGRKTVFVPGLTEYLNGHPLSND